MIKKGTIGLNNYRHVGVTKEGTEIIQEQIWFMDDLSQNRLVRKVDIPQDSGWRIRLEGDVNLVVDVKLDAPTQPGRTAMGISLTGFHCANYIYSVPKFFFQELYQVNYSSNNQDISLDIKLKYLLSKSLFLNSYFIFL